MLLIFSQKPILIELLNQTDFSSLKLLPFDNILIVTKAFMQKIRNVLWFTFQPHPQQEVGNGERVLLTAAKGFERRKKPYNHASLSIHHVLLFTLPLPPFPSSTFPVPPAFQIVIKKLLGKSLWVAGRTHYSNTLLPFGLGGEKSKCSGKRWTIEIKDSGLGARKTVPT